MLKLPFKVEIPVILLAPAAVALLGAAAYGGYFLYEMVATSVGAGGGKYAVVLPAAKPVTVTTAPQCAQKTMKWVGCY